MKNNFFSVNEADNRRIFTESSLEFHTARNDTETITLGPAYNELGYNEDPAVTSRFLCIKIIDCHVKKFVYNKDPLIMGSFFCLFLLVSVTQDISFYRPQRSCGHGNIFTPVCHSFCSRGGGGGLSQCMLGYHPPTHPGSRTPGTTHIPLPTPPGVDNPPGTTHIPSPPPRSRQPPRDQTPPREADSGIRSTSGRYASYWNAFLFKRKRTRMFPE